MIRSFDKDNFHQLCDQVASIDPLLKRIIDDNGYPPLWSRTPSFETLIHIILEQQVSLASARAALNKLRERIGVPLPEQLLLLTDEELKACYFSRQKIQYSRHLAESLTIKKPGGKKDLNIDEFESMIDDEVRKTLKTIKGIGDWTADVYLMMVLHRCDLFPVGDIALINSVRYEMNDLKLSKQDVLQLSDKWRPLRTIAAFIFWHAYICRKGIKV